MVILYRSKMKQKTNTKAKAKARSQDDRLMDILAARNIHLRCFHDIPMADIDLVFPEKTVSVTMYRMFSSLG